VRGKKYFCCIFTASYVIYWDLPEILLFVLGVINPQSTNPGPVMLHIILNTPINNYSLLLPSILTS